MKKDTNNWAVARKGVVWATAFFGTFGTFALGYSAYVTNMPATATAGVSQLSATEWNKIVTALQTLDSAISGASQAEAWTAASTGYVPAAAAWSTIP